MSLNRSTYYKRPDEMKADLRRQSEAALRAAIENVVADWPCYGYRRVTHELRRRGIVVNHKKVARIMRQAALTPHRVRRFVATTDSEHDLPIFPDLAGSRLVQARPGGGGDGFPHAAAGVLRTGHFGAAGGASSTAHGIASPRRDARSRNLFVRVIGVVEQTSLKAGVRRRYRP
jgi:transposase InsO family protein